MKVTVEFTGITKAIAQMDKFAMELPADGTYRDMLKELAARFPAMVGLIIDPDCEKFLSSNMFVIDGNLEFPAMLLDQHPAEGEQVTLMSVITGG